MLRCASAWQPIAAGPYNIVPLAFGMTPEEAAIALGVPLVYHSGRPRGGNLPRLWVGGFCWASIRSLRACAPVPQGPPDRLEEGLAPAAAVAVLKTLTSTRGCPFRPRPVAGVRGILRRRLAAQFARPRPARRWPRLHPLLGGRASQSAFDRELGARHHDRADRRRDHTHAGGLGRRHAAQSCSAGGRRALQGARGAVSRTHRSRAGPRARHRSRHLLCAAAAAGFR